ncbi:MAG: MBL fold metallo-hydrolase [Bacteroidota bacterium]
METLGQPVEQVLQKNPSPILPKVGLSVLWVGHATMLVQIRDKVFLTDPVFTNTVGLVARRSVEPGLEASAITRLDYTLISHLHFDHFNYESLEMVPKEGKLFLPPGGAEYTPEFGFSETHEMKPWEVVEENGVKITAVPVRHFGGRYGFDILWMQDQGYTGYVIEYGGTTVFFGGDTGYGPEFAEIGKRFSIDVALLPISPVEPREFMSRVHLDPKEAVQAFKDLHARFMIPMHYATFFQGLEPKPTYAGDLLKEIVEREQLQERIIILQIGEQRILIP